MVLLLDPDDEYAGMIHGLGALVPTATIKLTGKSVDFRELERAVFDVMGRARKARVTAIGNPERQEVCIAAPSFAERTDRHGC